MKKMARIAALALCLCLLLGGCGKAQNDADKGSVAPQPDPNRKAADSYSYTENANETYSYEVWGRSGSTFISEKRLDRPVSFDAISDEVLVVYGQAGTGVSTRWARFCNVQTEQYVGVHGYLAAWGTRYAFVDERSGGIHVFVCEMFDENVYHDFYTLEDIPENTDPIEDFALSEEGVLSVTYRTNSGNKTIQIDMTATQDE